MKRQHIDNKTEYDQLRQAIAKLQDLVEIDLRFDLSKETSKKQGESPIHVETKPVQQVKDSFKVILEQLRRIYKNQRGELDKSLLEGIQTIMVLVGEAATKLDKYTSLFRKIYGETITNLKEYKDLQNFYTRIFAHLTPTARSDLDFSQEDMPIEQTEDEILEAERKALPDVEGIKRDTDYELFLVEREDGEKFYSNHLLRHLQMTSATETVGEFAGDDPFIQIKNWEDKRVQLYSARLLKAIHVPLETFYQSACQMKEMELVRFLNDALMALMLASNPRNLLRQFSVKSCSAYFKDFQWFLRNALHSAEYFHFLERPPQKSQLFFNSVLEVMHGLCLNLYSGSFDSQEINKGIRDLIERGQWGLHPSLENTKGKLTIAEYLEGDYKAIQRLLKQFPSGPLFKALDLFLDEHYPGFDPLVMDNLPHQLYSLDIDGLYSTVLYLPSPTTQTVIQKAEPIEEFKGFLRAYAQSPIRKHHLLINMQDRTSWKEHARCEALEQLQFQAEFSDCLTVVTLPKETEFYYQIGPYQDLNQSEQFIAQFAEHITGEQSGFYFPKKIEKALFPQFINQLLEGIHHTFFFKKNVLSRRERLDFIELAYLLIQCKLIELTQAYSFSFTCKDAIDTGTVSSVQLFVFLKLLSGRAITEQEIEFLRGMLFAPALMVRERNVNAERFNRMLKVLKLIESEIDRSSISTFQHRLEQGLGQLYRFPILFCALDLP